MALLLAQTDSQSVQIFSLSAQSKAAAAQIGDRNGSWREYLSCPTRWVVLCLSFELGVQIPKAGVRGITT